MLAPVSCSDGSGRLLTTPPPDDPDPPDPPAAGASSVRVNEIMVSNTATLAAETGAYSPWLEIYNTAAAPVDLSGVSLSDDPLAPDKWSLPAGPASVVPARGYLIVFCDGAESRPSEIHAPFTLRPGPVELVVNGGSDLFFADGAVLGRDRTLGRSPDGGERIAELRDPSPGAPNTEPIAPGGRVRGDVDRDGVVDVTDALDILDFLFHRGFTPYCTPVADADGDGVVDVGDSVRILDLLSRGGPPLPELSPEELAACSDNLAPRVTPRPVYHTYPGQPVDLEIEATDPEDETLFFEAVALPSGAILDGDTGLVRWTPSEAELGPAYLTFVVSDEAEPPNRVTGRLVFQVHPLTACDQPLCDPAEGCEPRLPPLDEECCGSPGARVPDPDVGCPDGGGLEVGRNSREAPTIGRLVHCDLLPLIPLGQGGHVASLSLEARCLAPSQVFLEARLETAAAVLFEEAVRRDFVQEDDGYSRLRALRFIAEGPFANDMEAQLSVAVTDIDGARFERQLRVVLTRDSAPDLP
jgi:hypothetical protein